MKRRSKRAKSPLSRSERILIRRRRFLLACWLGAGAVLLSRAVELQVLQGDAWRAEAEEQQREERSVPAPRGAILDREGVPLALSHETFSVGVAPRELQDRDSAAAALQEILEISPSEARRVTTPDSKWVSIPGRYPPAVREPLASLRGVYVDRELRRFYPHDDLARGLLGAVIDEKGAGGIEQEFEDHLRGVEGAEMFARDSEGHPIPGETWQIRPPRPGGSVVLTLDASLQEIAGEALEDAVTTTGARGGDLLVTDPQTGEILAMVTLRDGEQAQVGGINAPYEPGSTLKPFTVATLLRGKKASLSDSVDTGKGSWTTHGRTITDVGGAGGMMTIAHALQVSSNVGIAKAASVLNPDMQYEGLRDFGFGLPTGIRLPGESSGTLRRPSEWSKQSAASLAYGYEISVTPLQLAMAYGALANGGVLMAPLLVKELRDDHGRVVEAFEPRAVRRVISKEVAREISHVLVDVVEDGTGTQARLASFAVAGKSGTSRAIGANGRYEVGAYYASFVGFFPAEDPQLVVSVKLDRPRGAYYGGATAAPVTRATMEAILAARESPLDRDALAALAESQEIDAGAAQPAVRRSSGPVALFASAREELPAPVAPAPEPSGDGSGLVIPDLRGMSPRSAARRLHSLGLHVLWDAVGPVSRTEPSRGAAVTRGDTVRLVSTFRGVDRGSGTR